MGNLVNMVFGPIVKAIGLLKGLLIVSCRLTGSQGAYLLKLLETEGKIYSSTEDYTDKMLPVTFNGIGWLGFCLSINIEERMLRAGYQPIDTLVYVSIFRWNKNRLRRLLEQKNKVDESIPVYLLKSWDAEELCRLDIEEQLAKIYPNFDLDTEYMEQKVTETISNGIDNLGIILYGKPGTGKSFYIRYLAVKYRLPIYIVSFVKSMGNHDVIQMFKYVKGPAIVLFEDFDNHFNYRECLLPSSSLTFDTILNCLDGIYSSKDGRIHIITANDITRIDPALRYRPSRFRFAKHMLPPSVDTRTSILVSAINGQHSLEELLELTEDLSLDQVFLVKDMVLDKIPIKDIEKCLLEISESSSRELERLEKLNSDEDGDENKTGSIPKA